MTDKELLNLAAKAVGMVQYYWDDYLECPFIEYVGIWNPLTDDGDALRLAADLRLAIKPGKYKGDGCTVDTQRDGVPGCTAFYEDEYKQMRQVIVRAAAEIGRSMQ